VDPESTRRRLEEARFQANTPRRLVDIDLALEKLDLGTYGSCETCQRTIELERLAAFPDTRFCRDHEPALEYGSH
jgi:RNA polymerase-binding transcription factor DksA